MNKTFEKFKINIVVIFELCNLQKLPFSSCIFADEMFCPANLQKVPKLPFFKLFLSTGEKFCPKIRKSSHYVSSKVAVIQMQNFVQ